MTLNSVTVPLFILASAGFYSLAMIAMKVWGQGGAVWGGAVLLGLVIAAAMLAGVMCEIEALKVERLGLTYVGILGAEAVMIAAASAWLFGEVFTAREVAGATLILAGTAIAWA